MVILESKNIYKFLLIISIMKGVFVIIDGMGDRPIKEFGDKTPLEIAETPNIDYLASNGNMGTIYPVKEDFVPGTSEGVLSLLGRDWRNYPRGWLEALGSGINLDRGDLAFRINFSTIENLDSMRVLDRRAGRDLSTDEAKKLAETINENINLPVDVEFKATIQHRGVVVFRGGFSDNITPTDPEYIGDDRNTFEFSIPEDEEDISEYSANIANQFSKEVYHILDEHDVNKKRRDEGKLPANFILMREPGTSVEMTHDFSNWACTSGVPVMKGIAKSLGMDLFEFEEIDVEDNPYENLKENLDLEIKNSLSMIKKNKNKYDYFLIYLKEVDTPGHDNRPQDKKNMLEIIDKKFFSRLNKIIDKEKVVVTCDHSTPCELKGHSSDKVPVLLCDWENNSEKGFSEREAEEGELDIRKGSEILNLFYH